MNLASRDILKFIKGIMGEFFITIIIMMDEACAKIGPKIFIYLENIT
jgi:hypothetical protein